MSEFYAYITHNNGLAVRRSRGDHAWQDQVKMIKHHLGLFRARDMDHAREIAEQLRDEYEVVSAHHFIRDAINAALGIK